MFSSFKRAISGSDDTQGKENKNPQSQTDESASALVSPEITEKKESMIRNQVEIVQRPVSPSSITEQDSNSEAATVVSEDGRPVSKESSPISATRVDISKDGLIFRGEMTTLNSGGKPYRCVIGERTTILKSGVEKRETGTFIKTANGFKLHSIFDDHKPVNKMTQSNGVMLEGNFHTGTLIEGKKTVEIESSTQIFDGKFYDGDLKRGTITCINSENQTWVREGAFKRNEAGYYELYGSDTKETTFSSDIFEGDFLNVKMAGRTFDGFKGSRSYFIEGKTVVEKGMFIKTESGYKLVGPDCEKITHSNNCKLTGRFEVDWNADGQLIHRFKGQVQSLDADGDSFSGTFVKAPGSSSFKRDGIGFVRIGGDKREDYSSLEDIPNYDPENDIVFRTTFTDGVSSDERTPVSIGAHKKFLKAELALSDTEVGGSAQLGVKRLIKYTSLTDSSLTGNTKVRSILDQLNRTLSSSLDISTIDESTKATLFDRQSEVPVLINAGTSKHAVSLLFFQNHCFVCIRGDGMHGFSSSGMGQSIVPIQFSDSETLNSILDSANTMKTLSSLDKEVGSFVDNLLSDIPSATIDFESELGALFLDHQQRTQRVGNCWYESPRTAMRALCLILAEKNNLTAGDISTKADASSVKKPGQQLYSSVFGKKSMGLKFGLYEYFKLQLQQDSNYRPNTDSLFSVDVDSNWKTTTDRRASKLRPSIDGIFNLVQKSVETTT